jgi:hypothetical protein
VLGAVLCGDRVASPHPHMSRVVDYDPLGFEFYFFLLGFYLRGFAAHSDVASPADVGIVLCFVTLDYIYCFVYSVFDLFYSFSLLYARLVVRTWRD